MLNFGLKFINNFLSSQKGEVKEYEYEVKMSCSKCSATIKKILLTNELVEEVRIIISRQRVYVRTSLPPEEILDMIRNTGRNAKYLGERQFPVNN